MQEARFVGACQDQHAGRPAPSLGWHGERKSIGAKPSFFVGTWLVQQAQVAGLGGLGPGPPETWGPGPRRFWAVRHPNHPTCPPRSADSIGLLYWGIKWKRKWTMTWKLGEWTVESRGAIRFGQGGVNRKRAPPPDSARPGHDAA